jgi:hypothetical protein
MAGTQEPTDSITLESFQDDVTFMCDLATFIREVRVDQFTWTLKNQRTA